MKTPSSAPKQFLNGAYFGLSEIDGGSEQVIGLNWT
jgi:hypothetical protein